MSRRHTRRQFLKFTSVAAVAAGAGLPRPAPADWAATEARIPFKLGMASYSLREFPTDKALEMTKRVGLKYIAFKSMHMPLDAKPQQIERIAAKVRDEGLHLYGAGVVYMNKPQEVDQAFDYAKAAGLKVIISAPRHEFLPAINEKVEEYDIKIAIHNHGPGDDLYPTPQSVYEKVKDLDPRIGLCIDVGHTERMGLDPSDEIRKYKDRLHDLHIKDVDKSTAEGTTVEMGRGVIDIPKMMRTLIEIKYTGVAAFEHEKDGKDPLPGLAESVGYTRGVLAAIV